MFIVRQFHSAAEDFCQALNKVATRCLLLLSEILTVRAPREKTRYIKHERTPIYYHCMSFGQGVEHTECRATRGCNGRMKSWLCDHDTTTSSQNVCDCNVCMPYTKRIHYNRCPNSRTSIHFFSLWRRW